MSTRPSTCTFDERGICQTDHRRDPKPAPANLPPPTTAAINVVEREGG